MGTSRLFAALFRYWDRFFDAYRHGLLDGRQMLLFGGRRGRSGLRWRRADQDALDPLAQLLEDRPRLGSRIDHFEVKLIGQLVELLEQGALISPETVEHVFRRVEIHA